MFSFLTLSYSSFIPDFLFFSQDFACTRLYRASAAFVSHLLLSVVDSRCLNDDRQVTARTDRKRMAYHLISKVLCILLMQSKTIVFLVSVPLLKLDHQIHRLSIFNAFYTKQGLNINNADTTQFNKILL